MNKKFKLKKGDEVIVLAGKDKGKTGKIIRQTKKYHVHDEKNEFNIGDNVSIIESKPISKLKKWRVVSNIGEKSWFKCNQNYLLQIIQVQELYNV